MRDATVYGRHRYIHRMHYLWVASMATGLKRQKKSVWFCEGGGTWHMPLNDWIHGGHDLFMGNRSNRDRSRLYHLSLFIQYFTLAFCGLDRGRGCAEVSEAYHCFWENHCEIHCYVLSPLSAGVSFWFSLRGTMQRLILSKTSKFQSALVKVTPMGCHNGWCPDTPKVLHGGAKERCQLTLQGCLNGGLWQHSMYETHSGTCNSNTDSIRNYIATSNLHLHEK